jgi:MFS family permease
MVEVGTGLADTAGLDRRRWSALPVLLIGSFLAFLDFFVVSIALPAMFEDLGGRLGDIFGRKRMFLGGITGFTLARRGRNALPMATERVAPAGVPAPGKVTHEPW